jgi:hypothetical protein
VTAQHPDKTRLRHRPPGDRSGPADSSKAHVLLSFGSPAHVAERTRLWALWGGTCVMRQRVGWVAMGMSCGMLASGCWWHE